MIDADDEVRDLATFYYHVLKNKDRSLISLYILEGSLYATYVVLAVIMVLTVRSKMV